MRKTLLCIAASIITLSSFAQGTTILRYVEVVPVEGASADALYDRAEVWVSQASQNPAKVMKYQNKENHQLILNPLTQFNFSKFIGSEGVKGTIEYTIKINTREGHYRIEITDCYHHGRLYSFGLLTSDSVLTEKKLRGTTLKWEQNVWTELLAAMRKEMAVISTSLKAAMVIPDSSQSEDW